MLPPPECTFCHHRNPPGAKFCNECGSPLHLAPCEVCGAINNLTDTHCWQCDGALRPPKPLMRDEDFERDPGTSAPELEQPLTASEQDYGKLERKLAARELTAPGLDKAPNADDPRPRRLEQASRDSNIPEPRSLFVQADGAPRSRWHGLMAAVFVVAVGSAIAVGAYLHVRDATPPEPIASRASPSGTRAEASTEPRVAPDVAAVPPVMPAPTTRPEPEDRDRPMEPPVASDTDKAPAAAPSCPPPVEAMALCEWLVHPSRQ